MEPSVRALPQDQRVVGIDPPPVIVRTAADLRAFVRARSGSRAAPLILALPGMSSAKAHAAAERITSQMRECGCALGAKFMAGGFALSVAVLLTRVESLTSEIFWQLAWAVPAMLVSAGAGKSLGLLMSRKRLRREVETLIAGLPNHSQEN